ncbi:MAG: InlB B-repeat-containing protein, partial [Kiritimatiellia bacterium]
KLYYNRVPYTVTYTKGEYGTFEEQQTENLYYGDKTPIFTGNPTGEEGWAFDGWNQTVSETVKGDATYTAQWKQNDYSVTYMVDEELYESAETHHAGDTVSVRAIPEAKPGYTFKGWTTDREVVTSFTMPAKDVTLTGTWEEKPDVTIKYEATVGGSVTSADEKLRPATGTAKGSKAEAKPGYRFVNWTKDDVVVSTDATFKPTKKPTEVWVNETTYTANFVEDEPVTIKYETNDAKMGTVSQSEESVQPATGEA